jgi:hypothetical protein
VSATLISFISGGIGAAVTLLVTYLAALRNAFTVRTAAMRVVSKDLGFTAALIETYQKAPGDLWGAQYSLAPAAWSTYRGDLASHLGEGSWADLQDLVMRLEVADRWAEELRNSKRKPDGEFDRNLDTLATEIKASTEALDVALVGSRTKFKRGRAFAFCAIAVALAGLIAALVVPSLGSEPVLTRASLASALGARTPGAQMAICDKSTQFEGAYLCTLTSRACDGSLEASTAAAPSCSLARRETFGVTTSGECFSASLNRVVSNGRSLPTRPPGRIRKALIKYGCIKG